KGAPVRSEDPADVLSAKIRGKSLSIFAKHDGRTYLADLRVFKDGRVELARVPSVRHLSTTELWPTGLHREVPGGLSRLPGPAFRGRSANSQAGLRRHPGAQPAIRR